MKEKRNIKFIGGSRIGSLNLTIPFASLKVTKGKLELNSAGFQNLIFHKQNLINIEEVYFIPIIAQGIKITHNISEYDKNVIFWSFTNPKKIIDSIKNKGLLDKNINTEIKSSLENSTSTKKEKLKVPPIAIISVLVLIIFGGAMIYKSSKIFNNYTTLDEDLKIVIQVRKMRVDHGFSFINNSIIIPSSTRLVSSRPEWFKEKIQPINGKKSDQKPFFNDLDEPFTILKNANSRELKVIKYDDTLLFQMPDPNYKDPYDPTFRDLYEEIMGN